MSFISEVPGPSIQVIQQHDILRDVQLDALLSVTPIVLQPGVNEHLNWPPLQKHHFAQTEKEGAIFLWHETSKEARNRILERPLTTGEQNGCLSYTRVP